jgi:predicted phosphodiesterase
MKILPISDTHFDLFHTEQNEIFIKSLANADLLILAGDAGESNFQTFYWIKQLCEKYPKVLMVSGNHSFWRSNPEEVSQIMRGWQKNLSNLYVLSRKHPFELNGQRFIGDVLWFSEPSGPDALALTREFPDYNRIRHFVPWVYEENAQTVDFFNEEMKDSDIVITHHMPTYLALDPQFDGDPWNHFFISPQDELIKAKKPKIWIFGHSHHNFNGFVETTRLILNPRGYSGENVNFNPNLIIEV